MSAPYTGRYSREALAAEVGPELFAALEAEGRGAPDPSPRVVELVRRIFACPANPVTARSRVDRAA